MDRFALAWRGEQLLCALVFGILRPWLLGGLYLATAFELDPPTLPTPYPDISTSTPTRLHILSPNAWIPPAL